MCDNIKLVICLGKVTNLNNERKNENRRSWETNHEQDVYNKELYDPEDENIESIVIINTRFVSIFRRKEGKQKSE